jgi:hypothetical protein
MNEPEATALIMSAFDVAPLAEHIELAAKIVEAYLNGIPQALKKKPRAPRKVKPPNLATSADGTASAA